MAVGVPCGVRVRLSFYLSLWPGLAQSFFASSFLFICFLHPIFSLLIHSFIHPFRPSNHPSVPLNSLPSSINLHHVTRKAHNYRKKRRRAPIRLHGMHATSMAVL